MAELDEISKSIGALMTAVKHNDKSIETLFGLITETRNTVRNGQVNRERDTAEISALIDSIKITVDGMKPLVADYSKKKTAAIAILATVIFTAGALGATFQGVVRKLMGLD